jgi:hypothetical protein
MKKKSFAPSYEESSTSTQYRARLELERVLNSFFHHNKIQRKTVKGDLLEKYSNKYEIRPTLQALAQDVAAVLEQKIKSLALQERNTIISLLGLDSEGLDEKVLNVLPFMKERAQQLLAKKDKPRQQRCDAVDLEIISDFMHEISRCECFYMTQREHTSVLSQ